MQESLEEAFLQCESTYLVINLKMYMDRKGKVKGEPDNLQGRYFTLNDFMRKTLF
jgi:hypothetical protein